MFIFASCLCPKLLKGHVVAYLTCVDSKGNFLINHALKEKRGRRNPPSAFLTLYTFGILCQNKSIFSTLLFRTSMWTQLTSRSNLRG